MTRPLRLQIARVWLVAARLIVVSPLVHAAPAPTTPPASPVAAAPASGLASPEPSRKARLALRELDRFLDHHPLLEDNLRLTPRLVTEAEYLHAHPELREFLTGNPAVLPALAFEPRHFLHRALMLQASAPIRWTDLAQLDVLFDRQPQLERELERQPELIHNAAFLQTHAPLREFLSQHAPLARVFLPAKPGQ